jgi:predicted deacetylase
MRTQYLIRIDDICPAMNWRVWNAVEAILREAGVKPLLAVVPDNCDQQLNAANPDPLFWRKVRAWQQLGWSIGLHGYQHRYESNSAGILGRNRYSEFAGLPEAAQEAKLQKALALFARNDVRADAWIAPAHSFDETTLRLLGRLGVDCVSDGYSLRPYVCPRGLFWVPQQLGRFRSMPFGTWTVCLHINNWKAADLARFRRDVDSYRGRIAGLGEIRAQYERRRRHWSDALFFTCFRMARSLRG